MSRKHKGRRNANSVKYRKKLARKRHKHEEARERGLEELRERTANRQRQAGMGRVHPLAQMLAALSESLGNGDGDGEGMDEDAA